jgi:hypothetical protein
MRRNMRHADGGGWGYGQFEYDAASVYRIPEPVIAIGRIA